MNWKFKVLTQFILAHSPYGEEVNHRLQRLRAERNGGSANLVRRRINEGIAGFALMRQFRPIEGAEVVEVGTGWDALPTIMLHAAGARLVHTYDHVPHLRADLAALAAETLASRALQISDQLGCDVATVRSRMERLVTPGLLLPELLKRARFNYVAPGNAADTMLPDRSVDIYYSFAVMEHVPESAVENIIAEARRLLKPDGIFYSLIGLHDHYNFDPNVSDVNFLKYPEWLWALFVKNKISYHNRLRERDFLDILKDRGAEIMTVKSTVDPDDVDRVKSMKIDKRFDRYSPTELATTRTEIIARFD